MTAITNEDALRNNFANYPIFTGQDLEHCKTCDTIFTKLSDNKQLLVASLDSLKEKASIPVQHYVVFKKAALAASDILGRMQKSPPESSGYRSDLKFLSNAVERMTGSLEELEKSQPVPEAQGFYYEKWLSFIEQLRNFQQILNQPQETAHINTRGMRPDPQAKDLAFTLMAVQERLRQVTDLYVQRIQENADPSSIEKAIKISKLGIQASQFILKEVEKDPSFSTKPLLVGYKQYIEFQIQSLQNKFTKSSEKATLFLA